MADNADQLKARINADPRVIALAQSRMATYRGHGPLVTNAELLAMGFPVEPDWYVANANPRDPNNRTVQLQDPSSWEREAVKFGASTIATFGLGTIADDLINGRPGGGGSSPSGGGSQPTGGDGTLPSRPIDGPLHEAVPPNIGNQNVSGGGGAPSFGTTTPPGVDRGVRDRIRGVVTDPRQLMGLAALIPQLTNIPGGGGGNNASESGLLDEARQMMALQRGRIEQTQPVFDSLIRQSYGSAPTRHRGAAPAGYQAPSGGYQFTPPKFGDR